MCRIRTCGDSLLGSPENCIIVIVIGMDIHEGIQHRVVFHERGFDLNLAIWHHERVLGIALFCDSNRLAVLVGHGNLIQCVALIRGDGDRYGVTLGGTLGRNGNRSVLCLACAHTVGSCGAAAATATTVGGAVPQLDSSGQSVIIIVTAQ